MAKPGLTKMEAVGEGDTPCACDCLDFSLFFAKTKAELHLVTFQTRVQALLTQTDLFKPYQIYFSGKINISTMPVNTVMTPTSFRR